MSTPARAKAPRTLWLRLGGASALLGITSGVVTSVLRLHAARDSMKDIFALADFSLLMLPSLVFGTVAMLLATVGVTAGDRPRDVAAVFVAGALSLATPFVFGAALGAIVVVLLIVLLVGAL